ncbi:unnamed protein product [Trichobilharzia regenti]|nr:unnamed protein product [Trichobilharzia regenti]
MAGNAPGLLSTSVKSCLYDNATCQLRIGGSKKFADDAGVIKRLEFPARSVSVTYAALHSGYTYTVSDLEPNSVYDVQLSAYYDLTLNMQSNWETTSCFTQMQSKFQCTLFSIRITPSNWCKHFSTLSTSNKPVLCSIAWRISS